MNYYIDRISDINQLKIQVRDYAVQNLNWKDRKEYINYIFNNINPRKINPDIKSEILNFEKKYFFNVKFPRTLKFIKRSLHHFL